MKSSLQQVVTVLLQVPSDRASSLHGGDRIEMAKSRLLTPVKNYGCSDEERTNSTGWRRLAAIAIGFATGFGADSGSSRGRISKRYFWSAQCQARSRMAQLGATVQIHGRALHRWDLCNVLQRSRSHWPCYLRLVRPTLHLRMGESRTTMTTHAKRG